AHNQESVKRDEVIQKISCEHHFEGLFSAEGAGGGASISRVEKIKDSDRQKIKRLKAHLYNLEVSEAELELLQTNLRTSDALAKRDADGMEAMLDAKRREKCQVDDQIKRLLRTHSSQSQCHCTNFIFMFMQPLCTTTS
ncbi:hypothetical protein BC938DRAFT_475359, partial [Jimgerdemannia flammicorona]